MITTVIFDIGNVLVDYSWQSFLRSFGLTEEQFERVSRATVLNEDWNEVDRGVLTTEEVMQLFYENDPGISDLTDRVLANVKGLVTRRDHAIPWILRLKERGFKVLVLSNFSEKVLADCEDAMDFLQYVDGGILSYQEKVIKPMPEIYERLIERYELKPEECVFLDDLQKNLDGAASFGMKTILVKSPKQAEEELDRLVQKYENG